MEKVEIVVVGAGLAGLATAYFLAEEGFEVLVVERGDYPGSKNVSGGRLYLHPVRPFFPDLWDEAPIERYVVKERLTVMAEEASTTFELTSERFKKQPYHSGTLLRSKFDRWFGERVAEKGAFIIPKYKVDDLIFEDGKVVGIKAGEAEIQADVVVAADGVLSFMAEKAGLRGQHQATNFAVGIKEVIELPARTIEERFNLREGEGAAQFFFGALTQGMRGGGFLYTNRESLSLGLVVGLHALMEREPPLEAPELMERFKERPEIRPLIEGGNLVEYSAHTIPEGGMRTMPRLFDDSILLVGDAAGLGLNLGLTVRGMDFALASGALAAQAIKQAKQKGDYSTATLSHYEQLLKDSFVLKDMQTFRDAAAFLSNPRLYNIYPQVICDLFEKLMRLDDSGKEKLSSTALAELKSKMLNLATLKDLLGLRRI